MAQFPFTLRELRKSLKLSVKMIRMGPDLTQERLENQKKGENGSIYT